MSGLSAFAILIGFGVTIAAPGLYEFTRKTCHFIYGEPLGQWETTNDIQCVRSCIQHENCTSLMYDQPARQCFLNSEIQKYEVQFPADCGLQYAGRVERFFGCDYGWQYRSGRCYLYVDQRLSWYGCDDYCIGENSYLAKVYNYSAFQVLYDVTQTGWNSASYSYYYPWVSVNDLFQENVFTDRDGQPIHPDVTPTVYNYGENYDCGMLDYIWIYLDRCDYTTSCLCEKDPGVIIKRP